jgi:phage tail-like protein
LSPSGSGTAEDKIGFMKAPFAGGFTNVTGLGINTQSIAYREGGYNTTIHQIPGMTTFNPISLNRGVIYKNDQAMNWMKYLFAATAGDGLNLTSANHDFRLDLKIYVLDHPNAAGKTTSTSTAGANGPKMGFHVHNAWISTLNYSDLDAGGNNIMVETIGLVHEGLSVFFTQPDKFDPLPNA